MIIKENCVFSWSLQNKHGNYCVKSHFSHTFFSHITIVMLLIYIQLVTFQPLLGIKDRESRNSTELS
jgi:hypothetical protein